MGKVVLLPNDQQGMGIYSSKDIVCTSRAVAEIFEKQHGHVLRDIEGYNPSIRQAVKLSSNQIIRRSNTIRRSV